MLPPAKLGSYAFLVLLVGCSREVQPCLRWAIPGETYEVTLGPPSRLPHRFDDPCEPEFDLVEGDAFRLRAIAPENLAPDCEMLGATVETSIPNVTLGSAGPFFVGLSDPEMQATYPDAQVQGSCRGEYALGLTTQTGVLHAYRVFYPNSEPECLSRLNWPEGQVWCWDSWLVQVKNSRGEVVADSTIGPG